MKLSFPLVVLGQFGKTSIFTSDHGAFTDKHTHFKYSLFLFKRNSDIRYKTSYFSSVCTKTAGKYEIWSYFCAVNKNKFIQHIENISNL